MIYFIDTRTIYLLVAWSFAYIIFIVLYRPYSDKIQQIGLIINQVVVCTWFGVLLALEIYTFSESTLNIISKFIVMLIAMVDLCAIIRIVY